MSNEDVIIAFLRKESFSRGNLRSNGIKLFSGDTCIGQWLEHRVIVNNTKYSPEIGKNQMYLYKWAIKSDIIFRVLDVEVPKGEQELSKYYSLQ